SELATRAIEAPVAGSTQSSHSPPIAGESRPSRVLSTSCMRPSNTAVLAASRERGVRYARDMPDLDALARELDEALLARREIQSLTKTHGDFDLATAYEVQERGIALRQRRGEKIVGYKMGLTSA